MLVLFALGGLCIFCFCFALVKSESVSDFGAWVALATIVVGIFDALLSEDLKSTPGLLPKLLVTFVYSVPGMCFMLGEITGSIIDRRTEEKSCRHLQHQSHSR
jgi:hypothetical protein